MRAKYAWVFKHNVLGIISAFIFYTLGSLLSLGPYYLIVITFCAFGLGIWCSITESKTKKQEAEFYMLIDFFQQVLALFKHHPKIYFSFTESTNLIKGDLKSAIDLWIEDLQQGKSLNESAKTFLNKYPHFVIGNLIHLMVAVELFGTHDYGLSLDIIQDDIEEWAEDTILYKQMEKQQRNRILLLSLFSLVIAYFSQSMLSKTGLQTQMDLSNGALMVFLLMIEVTIAVVQYVLAAQWVERSEEIWRT